MLQYLRQTVHLHSVADMQHVYDKFPETKWRRFRMCLRQCLQFIFSANKNFFELKKKFIKFHWDLNKNFIERCRDCAKWTAAIKFRSNLKKQKTCVITQLSFWFCACPIQTMNANLELEKLSRTFCPQHLSRTPITKNVGNRGSPTRM